MESVTAAALGSWPVNFWATALLVVSALVYLRGWLRIRRLVRTNRDYPRIWCFAAGLLVIFLATESPLDAFDKLFLSAHMVQHLLLLSVAPPLLLLGQPAVPLLRGLPRQFVKEALGPFLTSPALRRVIDGLTSMPVAWLLFAVSTVLWHVPASYELALSSAAWHGLQHASFFWTGVLFWLPLIRQGPGANRWPSWAPIPYLLFADVVNTVLSAYFVFAGSVLYPSYESVHISGMTAQNDQVLAGVIMWVPGSLIYLVPAVVFTMRIVAPERISQRQAVIRAWPRRTSLPVLSVKRLPALRRITQWVMLSLAIVIVADGIRGTQVAPLNLAGVLPWIHWRALSVAALLLVGNLFCMACPFTLVRDLARKAIPQRLRWPRILRAKWLAALLLVSYLWAYEALSLWNSPLATASIILGYFAAALGVDLVFRGASFCKYVCPIGQFHLVTSLVSPREVAVRKQSVCQSCRTHDCIRGNDTAPGCELYLFQPKKSSNLDCTFCLDCVKACPHDNVALLPVLPAKTLVEDPYRSSIGRLSNRADYPALALLIVFGAFANAAGMTAPVMTYEHRWHASLGAHAMPILIGVFVVLCAVALPALALVLCRALNRPFLDKKLIRPVSRRFIFALVPVGVAMWAAHLLFHFATAWGAAVSSITPVQILCLDAGLLLSLYVILRIAEQYGSSIIQTIAVATPWAILCLTLYGSGIWILFQPMEMRGMIH